MTICLAATYGNGEGVVLIADEMVTAHFPIGYEFESDEPTKIVNVGGADAYALIAGDVLMGSTIVGNAASAIQQQRPADEVAAIVRAEYQAIRRSLVIQTELEPRGLDIQNYYAGHQQLLPQIIQVIDQALSQSDLGVDVIVTGLNDVGKYAIFTVTNPGIVNDNSPIGYSAIGSGSPHAIYSLIEDGYKPSMPEEQVLEMVRKAKRRSEVAPGVGGNTQELVLRAGGSTHNDEGV